MDWLSRIYSGGWEAALLDLLDNAVMIAVWFGSQPPYRERAVQVDAAGKIGDDSGHIGVQLIDLGDWGQSISITNSATEVRCGGPRRLHDAFVLVLSPCQACFGQADESLPDFREIGQEA